MLETATTQPRNIAGPGDSPNHLANTTVHATVRATCRPPPQQDDFPQTPETVEREFQTDPEEQEYDAHLGQDLDMMGVVDESETGGPDERTCQDEPGNRRKVRARLRRVTTATATPNTMTKSLRYSISGTIRSLDESLPYCKFWRNWCFSSHWEGVSNAAAIEVAWKALKQMSSAENAQAGSTRAGDKLPTAEARLRPPPTPVGGYRGSSGMPSRLRTPFK